MTWIFDISMVGISIPHSNTYIYMYIYIYTYVYVEILQNTGLCDFNDDLPWKKLSKQDKKNIQHNCKYPNVSVSTTASSQQNTSKRRKILHQLSFCWSHLQELWTSRSPCKERQRLSHTNGIWQLPWSKLVGLTWCWKPMISLNKEIM